MKIIGQTPEMATVYQFFSLTNNLQVFLVANKPFWGFFLNGKKNRCPADADLREESPT